MLINQAHRRYQFFQQIYYAVNSKPTKKISAKKILDENWKRDKVLHKTLNTGQILWRNLIRATPINHHF